MAKNSGLKTQKNARSVSAFLDAIPDTEKKKDAKRMFSLMKEATGEKPVMWGTSIVGFGEYRYTRSDKKTFNWMLTGFSPRAQNLTVYIMPGFSLKEYRTLMEKLGTYTTGTSCLYIKHLSDIHLPTLKALVKQSYAEMKKRYSAKT
jgi:hypothetical protein